MTKTSDIKKLGLSRRKFLASSVGTLGAVALGSRIVPALAPTEAEQALAKRRPNVLILLSDDQGYGDLSSHGNPWLETPNLDALAKQSTELTRFYVCPLCSPTRSSLLTGRYNLRLGVHGVTRGYETMHSGETTLAGAFKTAGYKTAIFGKWHLGMVYPYVPYAEGFDEFIGFRQGCEINYWDSMLERNGMPYPVKGFITDALTDEGIRYIGAHQHEPFLLYMAYNVPHTPSQAPRNLFEHFRQFNISDYDASIYAMMSNLDWNIGRLLRHLGQLNLAEDTIVVFASDNGPNGHRFNCGFKGVKGSVDEGGVRVPFFIRWPGKIEQDCKLSDMAAHIDIYPTMLSLCGIKPPQGRHVDGIDLTTLLTKRKPLVDRTFFTHKPSDDPKIEDLGAVRTSLFCLIDRKRLYDIVGDPHQQFDIASQHPEQVVALSKAYDEWFADVTAHQSYGRLPIQVGNPEENPVTMPATEAYFNGALHYWGKEGWAWDWITGWSDQRDQIYWDIDVVRAGTYLVNIRYLCPAADVGSTIRVQVGNESCDSVVQYATSTTPIPTLDLVPRKEVPPMPWGSLGAGMLTLQKGRAKLYLKAVNKAGNCVMDVKEMSLRLMSVPESV